MSLIDVLLDVWGPAVLREPLGELLGFGDSAVEDAHNRIGEALVARFKLNRLSRGKLVENDHIPGHGANRKDGLGHCAVRQSGDLFLASLNAVHLKVRSIPALLPREVRVIKLAGKQVGSIGFGSGDKL